MKLNNTSFPLIPMSMKTCMSAEGVSCLENSSSYKESRNDSAKTLQISERWNTLNNLRLEENDFCLYSWKGKRVLTYGEMLSLIQRGGISQVFRPS